ncbi:MAG: 4-(cytidine 5-diphospho)-2-C-methyl-D-erythritol kinase [Sphingomonas bacterium]|nr:4-(cytidine 5-diphospho)-2-C-methyl-D-erythritol kinase [Sphingomonas bacterium]
MRRQQTAFAKINLSLHVRRRRPDGYHEIETIFAFAQDGDLLTLTGQDAPPLTIEGPFANGLSTGDDNLVLRAVAALGLAGQGLGLTLDKRLPVAAGIGGGSADAGAAIRLLAARAGKTPGQLDAIAERLGADVPACVASVTARAEGLGYPVRAVAAQGLSGMSLLLVNPGVACPTGPVFAAWDGIDRGALVEGDPLAAARDGRNDLEAPARALLPVIGDILDRLGRSPGAQLVRMSGSGATCFALFDSGGARDAAAANLRDDHPNWWVMATALR